MAKDVANWIGHTNVSKMIEDAELDETELTKAFIEITYSYGNDFRTRKQESLFLTEDGLYEVLMQSRKPIAKQFKRDVKAILKSIRKHGAYMTPKTIEQTLTNPDFIIQLATTLKEEQEKRKLAEQEVKEKQIVIDTVIKDDRLFSVGSVGKVLKPYCKLMGGRNIFKFLREKSIIIDKEGTHTHNMPYAKYDEYFEVKYVDSEYGTHSKCYFNGTGLKWFLNKLVKEGYINNEQKTKVENNLK